MAQVNVLSIVNELGLKVVHQTSQRYNCLCPFHHNTDSPAFSIDKYEGLWICFNEDCGRAGNLEQLVMELTDRSEPEAMRYIYRHSMSDSSASDFLEMLEEQFSKKTDLPEFPQKVVDETVRKFWLITDAQDYMHSRGFEDKTLKDFQVGYTNMRGGMVTVPVYTPNGEHPVGIVGRGIRIKAFENSKGLPRNHVLFNLHRARTVSSKVIVTESSFDAMAIEQAGFPNVVATLGSVVTTGHFQLLEKNFNTIVVFSDNDDAGMSMREKIEVGVKGASVLHAAMEDGILYPSEGKGGKAPKDACDLYPEQIQQMMKNATTAAAKQWA